LIYATLIALRKVLTGGLQVSEMLPSCDFMAADLVRAVLTLEGGVVVAPQLGCVVASDDDGGILADRGAVEVRVGDDA
jgi:hypothetical protein